jgi:trehalose 6-phosphate phosphatase
VTPTYLFSSKGLKALAGYVAPDTLFAFDLDGTLAPIVEDYSSARVAEPVRATLKRLVKLAKVTVITGRSRLDALTILGFEPHLLIGNHGAEWPAHQSGTNWQFVGSCHKWRDQLHEMIRYEQGVEIEFKGESVSLHYRKAIDTESALAQIDAAISKLEPVPNRIGGKYVVNLLPMKAPTKGEALIAAMNQFGLERAIFIGDDVTDEAVFLLKDVDVFGIHVGNDGQTAAPYYLKKQSALLGLLNSIVGILEQLWTEDEDSCSSTAPKN